MSSPSAPWPSLRRTPTSSGRGQARLSSGAMYRRATESINPRTAARPGRGWGSSRAAGSPGSSSIAPTRASFLRRAWGKGSGGPGGGLFKSTDGGLTWKKLQGKGLPEPPIGKVAVAVAARDSNRVYALGEAQDGGLWRSDDGGETRTLINRDHAILHR